MNIKQAKQQIENALRAYFTKDEDRHFIIPPEKQRPVFSLGPPGVGKTAIMEQIAEEMGVGLISYSMTHHTRQSALGLPLIEKKVYDGKEYHISEYTMSEIIASVYEMMEETGVRSGILFLDEINCVSETLSPIMLQFLQYKIFGKHKVPHGWLVVTAGNPIEYNDSAREFDMVTLDRLKKIEIEPDYKIWKEYAYSTFVHPSVISYLEIKKDNFYKVENSVDGKMFVTPRGWDDLSQMIKLYETHDLIVDKTLISQYLQNREIAENFSVYYDLFNKYKSDYQVDRILTKEYSDDIKDRLLSAKFDERLSFISLVLDKITDEIKEVIYLEDILLEYKKALLDIKAELKDGNNFKKALEYTINKNKTNLENKLNSHSLSFSDKRKMTKVIEILIDYSDKAIAKDEIKDSFEVYKKHYHELREQYKEEGNKVSDYLSNIFVFFEDVFKSSDEMLILVTEMTINEYTAQFINRFGCKEYFRYNKELLFAERHRNIVSEIENLEV